MSQYGVLAQSEDEDGHLGRVHDPSGEHAVLDTAGHFISSNRSTSAFAAQHQSGFGSSGHLDANGPWTSTQGGSSDTLAAIKARGLNFASYIKDKTAQARQTDWANDQTLSKLKTFGLGVGERVQSTALQGWRQAKDATSEGLRRLTGGPLAAICKTEAAQRPCPRVVLVCCTALVASGLQAEGLFQEGAPVELVHYLLGVFEEGQGAVLPPAGTQPHVLANAIKTFLLTLPEPLLTYKLLPDLINTGHDRLTTRTQQVLGELPPASSATLSVLLDTWHRLADNYHATGMDAQGIAAAVAPCLAWEAPPSKEARKRYQSVQQSGSPQRFAVQDFPDTASTGSADLDSPAARRELAKEDVEALEWVLAQAISNYKPAVGDLDAASPLFSLTDSPGQGF